jgi:hypothetical protein
MAQLPPTPKLVTVVAPNGTKFSVAEPHQQAFQGLINSLHEGGYLLDQTQSGGYNNRFIRGTETPSQHAFGTAIDVNWRDNPQGGGKFAISPDVARGLAKQYGMTWGGDWQGQSADPMHFEIATGAPKFVPAPAAEPGPGFGMASLPTPPIPPPGGAPAPAPAPGAMAMFRPPMPMSMPLGGQGTSLADVFTAAAKQANVANNDRFFS